MKPRMANLERFDGLDDEVKERIFIANKGLQNLVRDIMTEENKSLIIEQMDFMDYAINSYSMENDNFTIEINSHLDFVYLVEGLQVNYKTLSRSDIPLLNGLIELKQMMEDMNPSNYDYSNFESMYTERVEELIEVLEDTFNSMLYVDFAELLEKFLLTDIVNILPVDTNGIGMLDDDRIIISKTVYEDLSIQIK